MFRKKENMNRDKAEKLAEKMNNDALWRFCSKTTEENRYIQYKSRYSISDDYYMKDKDLPSFGRWGLERLYPDNKCSITGEQCTINRWETPDCRKCVVAAKYSNEQKKYTVGEILKEI